MSRIFHLQFNDTFYEVRIKDGVISRVTEYYGTNQFERECLFEDLPRYVKLAIVDELTNFCENGE